VGMGSFGLVGFFAFSSNIAIGVGGGVLGIILGGVVGSRLRKKIDLTKMSREQLTSFKIKCIMKWTKNN
jgi:Na+/glutamate symporter